MADRAVMPYSHYKAACDAIRAKGAGSPSIKSGDMAAAISSIVSGGGGNSRFENVTEIGYKLEDCISDLSNPSKPAGLSIMNTHIVTWDCVIVGHRTDNSKNAYLKINGAILSWYNYTQNDFFFSSGHLGYSDLSDATTITTQNISDGVMIFFPQPSVALGSGSSVSPSWKTPRSIQNTYYAQNTRIANYLFGGISIDSASPTFSKDPSSFATELNGWMQTASRGIGGHVYNIRIGGTQIRTPSISTQNMNITAGPSGSIMWATQKYM